MHSSLHCKIVSLSPYREWVNGQFVATLKKLTETGKQFGSILAAHSIATTLKYWYQGSPPGEIVSLGVLSEGKSVLFCFLFFLNLVLFSNFQVCSVLLLPFPHLLPDVNYKLSGRPEFYCHLFTMHSFSYPFRDPGVFVQMHREHTGIRPGLCLQEISSRVRRAS